MFRVINQIRGHVLFALSISVISASASMTGRYFLVKMGHESYKEVAYKDYFSVGALAGGILGLAGLVGVCLNKIWENWNLFKKLGALLFSSGSAFTLASEVLLKRADIPKVMTASAYGLGIFFGIPFVLVLTNRLCKSFSDHSVHEGIPMAVVVTNPLAIGEDALRIPTARTVRTLSYFRHDLSHDLKTDDSSGHNLHFASMSSI